MKGKAFECVMNRPSPSCPLPLFQNESKCESHLHENELRLVLKQRNKGSRKWLILNTLTDCITASSASLG